MFISFVSVILINVVWPDLLWVSLYIKVQKDVQIFCECHFIPVYKRMFRSSVSVTLFSKWYKGWMLISFVSVILNCTKWCSNILWVTLYNCCSDLSWASLYINAAAKLLPEIWCERCTCTNLLTSSIVQKNCSWMLLWYPQIKRRKPVHFWHISPKYCSENVCCCCCKYLFMNQSIFNDPLPHSHGMLYPLL